MANIGIVGGGVSGMHLSLLLQQRGIPVTLYADRTPEQIRASKLGSTAGHWAPTRQREKSLGINHWEDVAPSLDAVTVAINGERPIRFAGNVEQGAITVDYRVAMPRLQEDFAARGGDIVYGPVAVTDLDELSEKHSLVVVCAGRGSMTDIFPRQPERCRFSRPQRVITTTIAAGVSFDRPALNYEMAPGVGELLQFPFYTFGGAYSIMYFSAVPDGPLAAELDVDVSDDQALKLVRDAMLRACEKWFPVSLARVDRDRFNPLSLRDMLRGALTPTVRRPYGRLTNGKWVLACGDMHTVHDPLMGQGANSASRSAEIVADAITDDSLDFDEMWCQRTAERMWRSAEPSFEFTNEMLVVPPTASVMTVLQAASRSQKLADYIAHNFGVPANQWNMIATLPRAVAAVDRYAVPSAPGTDHTPIRATVDTELK